MAPALFEDEYYDILRKSRMGQGFDRIAIGKKAGLTPAEVAELEKGGVPSEPALRALAIALGLSAGKLADLALRPEPPRPAAVRPPFTRLEVGANCYIFGDAGSGKGFIVDPGENAPRIIHEAGRLGVVPAAILVTHAHGDHEGALAEISAHFPAAKVVRKAGQQAEAGALRGRARPVPGHTPDSLAFVFDSPRIVFTGDALFARSLGGATDYRSLLESVKTEILSLPPETVLCPGHGPLTTVAEELRLNPFFA